jgi:hypothetical protein
MIRKQQCKEGIQSASALPAGQDDQLTKAGLKIFSFIHLTSGIQALPLPSFHKTAGVVICCGLETGLLLPNHIQKVKKR